MSKRDWQVAKTCVIVNKTFHIQFRYSDTAYPRAVCITADGLFFLQKADRVETDFECFGVFLLTYLTSPGMTGSLDVLTSIPVNFVSFLLSLGTFVRKA